MAEQTMGKSARSERSSSGARSGGIVMLGSGASLAIQLLSLVVFSRLLTPADFGLVAMVTVFVMLGNLLRDFGLPTAGLQVRTLNHQQASNLFWMNVAVAAVAALLLAGATPLLVVLYDEPRLAAMVPVFAIVVLLGGASSQLQVNLARRMRFGALVASDIVAQVLAFGVAVTFAWMGAGYWSLVAQAVTTAVVTLLYRWIASAWIPSPFRRGHGAGGMFRVGAHYGVAQLLTFMQSNVDTVIIGARLGAVDLGYYNRAYQLLTVPAGRLLDPLTQVVVTTLHKVEARGQDRNLTLLRIQFLVGSAVVLAFSTTAGVAPDLIPMVLGDSWGAVVPVFQVLAIGGCILVFNHVSYWAFITYEGARELLRYNLVSKPLAIVSLVVGAQFGLVGVAWGYAVAMAFSWPLNLVWLTRTTAFRGHAFARNGAAILVGGAFAAMAAVVMADIASALSAAFVVVLGVIAGAVAMTLFLSAVPATRAMLAYWATFAFGYLSMLRARGARLGED